VSQALVAAAAPPVRAAAHDALAARVPAAIAAGALWLGARRVRRRRREAALDAI
jgi:hypothetical protein